MEIFSNNTSFLEGWTAISFLFLIRYVILSGIAYLFYYMLFKKQWNFKKIQRKFPRNKDYYREVVYSLFTFVVFGLIGAFVFLTEFKNYTKVYDEVSEYGQLYFICSIVIMVFIHDTYFYWTHRLMHHKYLFKLFHKVHHLSHNPSPWAAFAFHPLEAIIEASIIFVIVFTIPSHPIAVLTFLIVMTVYSVYGHLGYELYPKFFYKNWFGKWINTSINHNLHHQSGRDNYGIYFTFWDKVMKSVSKDYEATYDEVTSREPVQRKEKIGLS